MYIKQTNKKWKQNNIQINNLNGFSYTESIFTAIVFAENVQTFAYIICSNGTPMF
jgi:hypothetical protein